MKTIKVYGETYELNCNSCDAYAIVNDGGTETPPSNCPYCGSDDISISHY